MFLADRIDPNLAKKRKIPVKDISIIFRDLFYGFKKLTGKKIANEG